MSNSTRQYLRGLAAAIVALLVLSACGGGGGDSGGGGSSSGSTPTPVTVTCPDGSQAASADLCPVVAVVSSTPANGAVDVPQSTSQIVVTMSGTIASATMWLDGVKLVTSVKGVDITGQLPVLQYGQAPTVTFTDVVDSIGRQVDMSKVAITFTTAASVVPTATLSASPTSITSGQSATLSWSSTGASSCVSSDFATSSATSGSVSVSPTATTSYHLTCSASDGSGNTAQAAATVTVNEAAWWPPASITPVGTWVVGASVMPANCNIAKSTDQCYHDLVRAGGIKFIATSVTYNGRPFAYGFIQYTDPSTGNPYWNTFPVYADTGELVGMDTTGGATYATIDRAIGSAKGVVVHFSTGYNQGQCFEFNMITGASTLVTCPAF